MYRILAVGSLLCRFIILAEGTTGISTLTSTRIHPVGVNLRTGIVVFTLIQIDEPLLGVGLTFLQFRWQCVEQFLLGIGITHDLVSFKHVQDFDTAIFGGGTPAVDNHVPSGCFEASRGDIVENALIDEVVDSLGVVILLVKDFFQQLEHLHGV